MTTTTLTRFEPKPGQVVPFRSRVSYSFAEIGSHFTWTLVSSYLVLFYTDVALLAPATVALIMLVARIWDAVDDPALGYVAERTKSRWGRFRPYILFGSPLLAVMLVLTFLAPDFGGNTTAKVIYAGATYILLGVVYSAVNMTYGALAGVMTKDYDERVILNWYRGIGGQIGQVILAAIAIPLLIFFSGATDRNDINATGFFWLAVCLGAASIPLFLITFLNSKEVIRPEISSVRVPLRETLRGILTNRNLLLVSGALLFMLIGLFGRIGIVVYYVRANMGNIALMATVMTTFSLAGTAAAILMPRLATKFGKKQMLMGAMVAAAVILTVIFMTPATNHTAIIVLTAFYGFTMFGGPIALSMIPDCVDDQELRTGVRSDGTAYAFTSLSTKIASALGGSVGILVIGAFGYVAGQDPSPSVLQGINVATNLVPAVFALLGAALIFFYNLDEKTVRANRSELDARGAAGAADTV
jgi:sugar (glycoside-pentoside-hexuronide) transporter